MIGEVSTLGRRSREKALKALPTPRTRSIRTWRNTREVQSSLQITGNNELHFLHYRFGVSPSDMLIQCVRRFDELHGHIGNLPEPIGGESPSPDGQRKLHGSVGKCTSLHTT